MKKYQALSVVLAMLTAGFLIAANSPDMRLASGKFLIGNASGIAAPVTLTGDVTSTNGGVTAIGSAKVLSAMVDPTLIKFVRVPVTAGEIAAIATTPKTIVAAPGVGFTTVIHKCLLVSAAGTAYTTNGLLGLYETNNSGQLITGTLTLAQFLGLTASTQKEIMPNVSTSVGITRLDNKAIVLSEATGDPATGNFGITVHCWYSTIPSP